MIALRYWFEGTKMHRAQMSSCAAGPDDENEKFKSGQVRLITGTRGTELKWFVGSPCNASLFGSTAILEKSSAPYILRFYASGWFEEFYQTSSGVINRIENVIARGDRHFTCKTVVKQFEMKTAKLSPLLEHILEADNDMSEYGVECALEETSGQFHVAKIGERSAIAQVYGRFLSSFPCRPSGPYSDGVGAAYFSVLNNGHAQFDQVLAAMRMPNNQIHWVPYSRIVKPVLGARRLPSVMVVSELGRVDIQLI